MTVNVRSTMLVLTALALALAMPPTTAGTVSVAEAAPEGQITYGVHITIAARFLDPADAEGIATPFMILGALHDAMVKPMPSGPFTPALAQSWSASKDGLTYDFVIRKGAKFHNGEPVTAEDVKFSFERYRGAGSKILKDKMREVQAVDPGHVRFRLKEPWPDFLTFYGTMATGSGWIVPKKYVEKVGEDGFKRAPVGAGPYRFISFNPGVELVVEAFDGYWRKTPNVKRLVFRTIAEESTRAAALKKGEVDIAYLLTGPIAEEIKKTPNLKLAAPLLDGDRLGQLGDHADVARPVPAVGRVRLGRQLRPAPVTLEERRPPELDLAIGLDGKPCVVLGRPDPHRHNRGTARDVLRAQQQCHTTQLQGFSPVRPARAVRRARAAGVLVLHASSSAPVAVCAVRVIARDSLASTSMLSSKSGGGKCGPAFSGHSTSLRPGLAKISRNPASSHSRGSLKR